MEHQLATNVVSINGGVVECAVNNHNSVDMAIAPVRENLVPHCGDEFG